VAERCAFRSEVRSLDAAKAEAVVAQVVDAVHDAANVPSCQVDADVRVAKLFDGYRHAPDAPAVLAAERALAACGYTPRRIVTGGGSDANALQSRGFACTNLANGTERNHQPEERVSQVALEGMLDVLFALMDEI
jgi:tripeptide aminopeptidase